MDSLRRQCRLSFVSLKKCNRSAQIRNKHAREKTQEVVRKTAFLVENFVGGFFQYVSYSGE